MLYLNGFELGPGFNWETVYLQSFSANELDFIVDTMCSG